MTTDSTAATQVLTLRPAEFLIVRTPSQSFEWLERLLQAIDGNANGRFEEPAALRALVELAREETISWALWLASPVLAKGVASARLPTEPRRRRRLIRSLYSYFTRMSTRPTPFGLFATTAMVVRGERSSIEFETENALITCTRLDARIVRRINELICRMEAGATDRFSLSVSSISVGDALHSLRVDGDRCEFTRLQSVTLDLELDSAQVLDTIQQVTYSTADRLAELGVAQQRAFVSLLDVSPLTAAIARLGLVPATQPVAAMLDDLNRALLDLDSATTSAARSSASAKVESHLNRLVPKFSDEPRVHVDAVRRVRNATLSEVAWEKINSAINVAARACGYYARHSQELEDFRRRFHARYDTARVPLLEALDPEVGIGFAGIEPDPGAVGWRTAHAGAAVPSAGATLALDSELLKRVMANPWALTLDVTDLVMPSMLRGEATVPEGGAAVVSLGPLDNQGRPITVYVKSIVGPTALRLLGRFAHLTGDISAAVKAHTDAEEAARGNADGTLAEIGYVSEVRAGNVQLRPNVRKATVWLGPQAHWPYGDHIALSDLDLQMRGYELKLWSRRLSQWIVPRLGCAHNYKADSNPAYRLLADLQADCGEGGAVWSWGPLGASEYLPRVTAGDAVLALRRWQLRGDALVKLRGSIATYGAEQAIGVWRTACNVPRYIALVDYDNELFFDLDSALSLQLLAEFFGKAEDLRLCEVFPRPDEWWVRDVSGERYSSELLVPFVCGSKP